MVMMLLTFCLTWQRLGTASKNKENLELEISWKTSLPLLGFAIDFYEKLVDISCDGLLTSKHARHRTWEAIGQAGQNYYAQLLLWPSKVAKTCQRIIATVRCNLSQEAVRSAPAEES